ncbi:MAG: cytochrome c [Burkholderiaceae bacterium]|nr:cytochrome c [Burkholderiaceae bacterium]
MIDRPRHAQPSHHQVWVVRGVALFFVLIQLVRAPALAEPVAAPSPARQQALVHVVRQDCGSCHGMHLTGGLGSALTADLMRERPLASLVATILHGRPGTPMPGWQGLLSEQDAWWIAQQLQAGFPQEPRP